MAGNSPYGREGVVPRGWVSPNAAEVGGSTQPLRTHAESHEAQIPLYLEQKREAALDRYQVHYRCNYDNETTESSGSNRKRPVTAADMHKNHNNFDRNVAHSGAIVTYCDGVHEKQLTRHVLEMDEHLKKFLQVMEQCDKVAMQHAQEANEHDLYAKKCSQHLEKQIVILESALKTVTVHQKLSPSGFAGKLANTHGMPERKRDGGSTAWAPDNLSDALELNHMGFEQFTMPVQVMQPVYL
ncbi:hypothetical protein COEREDRAFT_7733 [Coemansia reversa NRRL 1564]|uniref:Uncharacterized protein n=1 Tax=Coemansia reversa (strain ATCC 12441 / NRRL 1564) TaxID=763665 RepID=A0A2G5BEE5_COERN|nr:hypothetical protein COEREDRAFT_7733 [Coemansia reversa NRRL 1564]|eukprot:PIA17389.1 hypothetical protein COEREDRAFT_7733 [Coemansia reversa NRRL 1564]